MSLIVIILIHPMPFTVVLYTLICMSLGGGDVLIISNEVEKNMGFEVDR